MAVLFKYARKFLDKKGQEKINVGIFGFPNVGKSSIINVLKNKPVVNSGSSPFITVGIQQVKLNKHVTLIDSPGVLLPSTDGANASQILRSAIQVEDLFAP
jgi:nuclear GTP-binding protein